MIKIGIIGCGYWGPNLLRSFFNHPSGWVKTVCDLDPSRLDYVKQKYPTVSTCQDYHQIVTDPEIDAVIIATGPTSHYALAKEALMHGKHVLVEKPLALSSIHAEELVNLAAQNNCLIMVGHTFLYNNAVKELKNIVQNGVIGQPYYIYSQRLNYGIVRQDTNALWSLAPHDISILIYVLERLPIRVSARGYDFIHKKVEDVVFVELEFPDNIKAHVQVSWLDPNKVRRMTVVGSEKMVVYDDVSDNKLQVFDKGINSQTKKESLGAYDSFAKFQQLRAAGDVMFPKIDFIEPLQQLCDDFLLAISERRNVTADALNGYQVVKILEAASESLVNDGKRVSIDYQQFINLSPEAVERLQ